MSAQEALIQQQPAAPTGAAFRGQARQGPKRFLLLSAMCVVLFAGFLWGLRGVPPLRSRCLAVFCFCYLARLLLMAGWLLPRELAIEEITVVPLWIATILCSYCAAARLAPGDLLAGTLGLAASAYVLGSYLNTGSELQRMRWKARPENKGRCYMEGLFALSRNINYLGDVILFAGWALATGRWWNVWVPLAMGASFYWHHIPDKEAYLRKRYAADWPQYERQVKSFIPFVC